MNNPPETQTPGAASPDLEIKLCPSCHRKLLTQASVLCNWCGAKIDDPEYLARAAQTRQERDEQERAQMEQIVQEETRYGVFGRLKRRAKKGPSSNNPLI